MGRYLDRAQEHLCMLAAFASARLDGIEPPSPADIEPAVDFFAREVHRSYNHTISDGAFQRAVRRTAREANLHPDDAYQFTLTLAQSEQWPAERIEKMRSFYQGVGKVIFEKRSEQFGKRYVQ